MDAGRRSAAAPAMALVPAAPPAASALSARKFIDGYALGVPAPYTASSPSPSSSSRRSSATNFPLESDRNARATPSAASASLSALGASKGDYSWAGLLRSSPASVSTAALEVDAADFTKELFRELRHLREGVALAANCNTVLQSRMESVEQNLFAGGRGETAARCRTVELRLFMRQALLVQTGERMVCFGFRAWALLTGRRRWAVQSLSRSAEHCLMLRVCLFWRGEVDSVHFQRAVTRIETDRQRLESVSESKLSACDAELNKLHKHHVEQVENLTKKADVGMEECIFKRWAEFAVQAREQSSLRASSLHARLLCLDTNMEAIVLHAWQVAASTRHLATDRRKAFEQRIRAAFLLGVEAMAATVLQAWKTSIYSEKRLKETRRRSSLAHAEKVQKLAEAKYSSMAVQDDCRVKVLATITNSTASGLLRDVIYAWKAGSSIGPVEEWIDHSKLVLTALRRSRKRCRGGFGIVAATCQHLALRDAYLRWCMAAWARVVVEGVPSCTGGSSSSSSNPDACVRGSCSRLKLDLQLARQPVLLQEIQDASTMCLEGTRVKACQVIWSRMTATASSAQHEALQRWRLMNTRMATAETMARTQRQKDRVKELETQHSAVRAQSMQQRCASVLALAQISRRYEGDVCHLAFRVWAVDAHYSAKENAHMRKLESLGLKRENLRLARSEDEAKRRDACMSVMRACNDNMLMAVVVQRWKGLAKDAALQEELEALQKEADAKKSELAALFSKKARKSLQMTLGSLGDQKLSPIVMTAIVHSWHAIAKQEIRKERRRLRQQAHFADAVDMCHSYQVYVSQMLLVRTIMAFRLAVEEGRLGRDIRDLSVLSRSRLRGSRRLRIFVQLSSQSVLDDTVLRFVAAAFGEWRSIAGIVAVDRMCDQVCKTLDDRVTRSREALTVDEVKIDYVSQTLMRNQDLQSSSCFVSQLVLPAWHHVALIARRRRIAWSRAEAEADQAEALRQKASSRYRIWREWLATRQWDDHAHNRRAESFHAWQRTVRFARQTRAEVLAGAAALAGKHGNSFSRAQLRGRCFRAWLRWRSEEKMLRLEREVHELEQLFPSHAQPPSPASSASSSSYAASEWDPAEDSESWMEPATSHFGFWPNAAGAENFESRPIRRHWISPLSSSSSTSSSAEDVASATASAAASATAIISSASGTTLMPPHDSVPGTPMLGIDSQLETTAEPKYASEWVPPLVDDDFGRRLSRFKFCLDGFA
eukprot:TRINITY_DN10814_c0_g2_i1.p1 TRINITY_DN10814_c0_g2~~TRINITY_DN10814_c0_g2_i1.p1  ORF type:complete len:1225 (-),score=178.45 TRINITY_DN10814_c0_g2_i1:186-3860(-)